MNKWTLIAGALIILLIAGNVYQFQNPKTIEIPAGTEQIDSTSWVKRSALADKETIIDSLQTQNKSMAGRIDNMSDQIANYTSITGRLKTQVDSLQEETAWNAIPLVDRLHERDSIGVVERSFTESKTFGDGLFRVAGTVDIRFNPCGLGIEQIQMGIECPEGSLLQVRQDFKLTQIRDIRIDQVTTVNEDRSRVLTYVTSPDFEELEYQSFTELKPTKRLPWFWIGLGAGFAGAVLLL